MIALGMAFAALPAHAFAQTPDVLACMDSGYSEQQQAAIDRYVNSFDLDTMGTDPQLVEALADRAAVCAGTDYADEASMMAILEHKFAGLSLDGIAATRPDVAETVRRMDEDLDEATRQRLFYLFEVEIFGDPQTGQTRELTVEEEEFFGEAILNPSVSGSIEQAEMIGAFMAARLMQRDAEQRLAAR
ncbi:hypothetical protein ACI5KX_07805 [Erythrobacter sp. GH1-10]|uniref:hypothetical protein n=1 Tax=Erythrobacter sp. GH1-10 TaxID=3349334 RepID=UPI0038781173